MRFVFGLFIILGRPIWSEMSRLVQDPQTYEDTEDVSRSFLLVNLINKVL